MEPTATSVPLTFRATPRPRRLAAVIGLTVVAAIVTAHGELAVLAVPPLVLLVLSPRSRLPTTATATVTVDSDRCVERDELALDLRLGVVGADRVELSADLPAEVEVGPADTDRVAADGLVTARWVLTPQRWGRYRGGRVVVRVLAGHGMYAARFELPVPELVVYPRGGVLTRPVSPRELPAGLGEHPSRAIGTGVEFAGVRPYATGDRRRDVDWRTSARQQRLFVRQYSAERPLDIVVVLDVAADAGEPGASTLDLTVRAALGVARTYLRVADRVGLVTLGRSVRWITPSTGMRNLHRLAEALMQVRLDDSEVGGGVELVPPAALPSRAFVCVVSPLLDDRALAAVRDLRARGFGLVVIDVLTTEPVVPPRSRHGALALRVWRMQRQVTAGELAGLGVPLVHWDGEGDLSGALLRAMRALRPEVRA